MKLTDIARITHQALNIPDQSFQGISIDTRTLKPGQVFAAIAGEQVDGHDYLKQAENAGAIAAIVQQTHSQTTLPCFVVENTLTTLQELAAANRRAHPIPLIAVTGSCGKTSTRQLITKILERHGNTLSSIKSYNNLLGVSLTLSALDDQHQYAVCELGANHPGEIAQLTHLAHPQIAIITNAAPAHLEGFESLEGVACAKGEIFQGLGQTGTAIINADSPFADFWRKLASTHRVITFGRQRTADIQAAHVQLNANGNAQFTCRTPTEEQAITLPLLGEHHVENALAACAACVALNIPLSTIAEGLTQASNEPHRMQALTGLNNSVLIDDTYNANPQSVAAAIDWLAHQNRHSILVLGDMLELGETSAELHRQVGLQARARNIDYLFTYGKESKHTHDAFEHNSFHFDDHDALTEALKALITPNSTVLVKGSNGMNMHRIVDALTQ